MDHLQNVLSYFDQQQPLCAEHDSIPKDLYREFGVKAGLRDETGKGVLAGLTNISDIRAFQYVDGVKHPADGQLLYRGYDVKDLINGSRGSRFAFEEAGYLLLFGQLPTPEQLEQFCAVLGECRTMPTNFTRDVIMKAPSHDIMNSMARSVLTLASYDPKAADLDTANVLRQSIQLAGIFPMLAVYSYHAYNHYEKDASMYIHRPDPSLSTAENFLRMLRPDMQYTPLEARVLDVALLRAAAAPAQHRAEAAVDARLGDGLAEIVHVKAGRDAAREILEDRQLGKRIHRLGRELGLEREDLLEQPRLQRHIIGIRAHKAHAGVRVRVLKARHDKVAAKVDLPLERGQRLRRGTDVGDLVPVGPDLVRRDGHAVRHCERAAVEKADHRLSLRFLKCSCIIRRIGPLGNEFRKISQTG